MYVHARLRSVHTYVHARVFEECARACMYTHMFECVCMRVCSRSVCACVHACAIQEDVWERLCGPEKRQFEMMRPLEVSTGNGVEEQGAPTALWWEPTP